jgi:alkanesulfonate monooxygenase SsuD/methylene tetrahydromethanopterin reductase-like flavin-dependent oxidoreductase (luciferase family)
VRRPFRFGVNLLFGADRRAWAAKCRRAEQLGYDVILTPDHLGHPDPFLSLLAAAEATERPRVGTYVLNVPLWNPAMLRRAIETTDRLTGGRFELGLGAGRDRGDADAAGVEWPGHASRVARLEPLLDRPFPGPVLIAGSGERILALAARRADIVAFRPVGDVHGVTRLLDAAAFDERTAHVRARTGERATPIEANILLRTVVPTTHRRIEAERLRRTFPELSTDALLETPALLIGTVTEMATRLRESRERFGFSYVVVQEPSMEALAPVIEAVAGE